MRIEFPINRFQDRDLRDALRIIRRAINDLDGRFNDIFQHSPGQNSPPVIRDEVLSSAVFGTTAPANVSTSAAAVGTSEKSARNDHVHKLDVTVAPFNTFLKADGSVVSTGSQEFSNAIPLKLTNDAPVVECGSVDADSTITFEGQNSASTTFRYLVTGGATFDIGCVAGGTNLTASADLNAIVGATTVLTAVSGGDVTLAAAGDIKFNPSGGDVTIGATSPFAFNTGTGTLTLSSATPLDLSNAAPVVAFGGALTFQSTAFTPTVKVQKSGFASISLAASFAATTITTSHQMTFTASTGNLVFNSNASSVLFGAAAGSQIILNYNSLDADTIIKGDNDAALVHVDASTDRVGFGTSTPDALVQVAGDEHVDGNFQLDGDLNHDGSNIGFFTTAPAAQQTVTGSRGGNAALASLLTALASYGLVIDSTT